MTTSYTLANTNLQRSRNDLCSLVIFQLNCNSVYPRLSELRLYLYTKKPDIFCLCETRVTKSEPRFLGYQAVWRHRANGAGGGLCILVRNDINFTVNSLVPYVNAKLEFISVKFFTSLGCIDLLNVYNPCADISFAEFDHVFSQLCPLSIIIGDFNAHSPLWDLRSRSNLTGRSLEQFLDQNDHGILNDYYTPTYICARTGTTSCLDLCFASLMLLGRGSLSVGPDIGSDHLPLECRFSISIPRVTVSGPPRWRLKRGCWSQWYSSLSVSLPSVTLPASAPSLSEDLCARLLDVSRSPVPVSSRGGQLRRRTPWWDAECSMAVAGRRRARQVLSRSPTPDNLIEYKRCSAIARHVIKRKKKDSWRSYVGSLSQDTPVARVWRAVRSMNGVASAPAVLPVGGPTAPLALKAQFLLEHFVPPFRSVSGRHADTVRNVVSGVSSSDIVETEYNVPFTHHELRHCLSLLKSTSPGHDGIVNDFLRRLPLSFLDQLLYLFNVSYFTGVVPASWKLGIICPILKPQKNPVSVTSYRPITLLSCVGKLMERLIKCRLDHFLESKRIFSCYQTGFRQGRSTADALVLLKHCISGALSNNSCCLTVYLDLAQAYDCVWRMGLLFKLLRLGCDLRTVLWLQSYFSGRSVKVRVGDAFSETRDLQRGLPQGAVLSPTLFNVMLYDLPTSPHVRVVSYADDITLVCTGGNVAQLQHQMQLFLDVLSEWFSRWDLKINPNKSSFQVFSRARRVPALTLTVSGHRLSQSLRQRVLGVLFDAPRLTLVPHLQQVRSDCLRRLNVLRALSGLTWSSSREVLRRIYIAFIRSKMCYGQEIYPDFPISVLRPLSVIQNSVLRCILGARKTSPVLSLEVEGFLMPLDLHFQFLYMKWCLRQSCGPVGLSGIASVIALFSSPPVGCFSSRRVALQRCLRLPAVLKGTASPYVSPVPPSFSVSSLVSVASPDFSLPSLVAVNDQFTIFFSDKYPSSYAVYTDGSKLDTGSVSAGMYVARLGLSFSWLIHPSHSVMGAELFAILRALRFVAERGEFRESRVVILSDSMASLYAIMNTGRPRYRSIIHDIQRCLLNFGGRVVLQWVPAHCGIDGNEVADSCAKMGHNNPFSTRSSLAYEEMLPVLRDHFLQYWIEVWRDRVRTTGKGTHLEDLLPVPCLRFCVPGASRRVQCVISRLRIGHVGVQTHLFRFNLSDSPLCSHCHVPETIHHFLLICPQFAAARSVLRGVLESLNVVFTLPAVLGCAEMSCRVRCRVLRALAGFLVSTGRSASL